MSRNYSTTKIEMSKFDHAILISMLDIKNMKHASYTHTLTINSSPPCTMICIRVVKNENDFLIATF